jgi:hypothetical protein
MVQGHPPRPAVVAMIRKRIATAVWVLLAGSLALAWDLPDLRVFSGLGERQWKAALTGAPQVKLLNTSDRTEVAVVGVVRLHASVECFLEQFQDIQTFKKSPLVQEIHKFSFPVQAEDLAQFTLERRDLAGLRECREGGCNVKLPAETIARLQHEVDWSQPDYLQQAQTLIRQSLLRYLERYELSGNPALMVYADKSKPVRLAAEIPDLLNASPGLGELSPKFLEYLLNYPRMRLANVSDFLYWSVETPGPRRVASITHVFIYREPGRALAASEQLYASHYFESSLGLTAVLDDPTTPGTMVLVYLNRSRVDLLREFWGRLVRPVLRSRLQEGMMENLARIARNLQAACTEAPAEKPSTE